MVDENDDASLSKWADELEEFLGSEECPGKPSRQQKEVLLDSVAKHMLENPEQNNKKSENNQSGLEIENKKCETSHSRRLLYFVVLCILSFGLIKYGFCQGKSLKLCWNNNIQDWIYPVLRTVRLIALPIIRYFPSITDIHEETCLVENPLYWDYEVDCTLCQDVGVVTLPHAEQFEELFYHKGVPVVVQDAIAAPVSLPALSALYGRQHEDIVAGSGRRLRPALPGLASLDDLLGSTEDRLAAMAHCVQWRLLRVSAVRHLRQLFRRPYFISKKTEVSLHRYIYICGDQGERFSLPMTEFANVWVSQHSGMRQIQLAPSSECSATCRTVSALLRPGETLFYNWRYWRASSLPIDAGQLEETDASQIDDQQTEKTCGQRNEKSPDQGNEKSSGQQTEKSFCQQTEKSSGQQTEKSSGQQTEKISGQQTEKISGQQTEKSSGQQTEKICGQQTEKISGQGSEETCGQESEETDLTETGGDRPAESVPSAPCRDEGPKDTEASPTDGRATEETDASWKKGQKTPAVQETKGTDAMSADWCGIVEETEESRDSCVGSGETDLTSQDPTVSITFVGSFY